MSMFGREFKSESSVLIFLSISTIFMAVNNVIGQVIASKDKMWVGFIFNLAWGGSLIVLSYIFIYIYNLGALSLALAYLLSYLFHTLWQFVYLKVFSLIN
jgi:O-antigen/teichoic acid export membrane protein